MLASRFVFRTTVAITSICGSCHETSAQYTAWKKSDHSRVSCLDCHSGPGIVGYVSVPKRALRSLGVKMGVIRRASAVAFNYDNCLRCHDTILDGIVIKRGIKVSHREIVDDGRACGDCHAGVGHEVKGAVSYDNYTSMDKCLYCHKSGRLGKCKLCHVNRTGKGLAKKTQMGLLAHDKGWGRRHGVAESRSCRLCHEREFCGECHKIEMPHRSNWPSIHGNQSQTQGGCAKCHKPKFCTSCHQIKIPHESGWKHGSQAKKKREVCDRCHTEKHCKDCHDLHDTHLLGGQ